MSRYPRTIRSRPVREHGSYRLLTEALRKRFMDVTNQVLGFVLRGELAMRDLKQKRAEVTREKIVGDAGRLFALKGDHDTSLEEILQIDKAFRIGVPMRKASSICSPGRAGRGTMVVELDEIARRTLAGHDARTPGKLSGEPIDLTTVQANALQVEIARLLHLGGILSGKSCLAHRSSWEIDLCIFPFKSADLGEGRPA